VDLRDLSRRPEETGTTEALIRGVAAEFSRRGINAGGFNANANSTVLSGSGLSSSAAVEVLFGRIFDNLYGEGKHSALEIAQIGQKAENEYFGKPCGLMDQIACASGGAVAIDFACAARPEVEQVAVDLAACGFSLCVVNTRGSHADLTPDYAAIPAEMNAVAAFFGKNVLGELRLEAVLANIAKLREAAGDRAVLRALHFFNENRRVDAMLVSLRAMNEAVSIDGRQTALRAFLALVTESGDSSWELLQNVYSPSNVRAQGIGLALALTRHPQGVPSWHPQGVSSWRVVWDGRYRVPRDESGVRHPQGVSSRRVVCDGRYRVPRGESGESGVRHDGCDGASRVHGGGFAGTIQTYLPSSSLPEYVSLMESVFGKGAVTPLRIRPIGAAELRFGGAQ
jgi:galactokinase